MRLGSATGPWYAAMFFVAQARCLCYGSLSEDRDGVAHRDQFLDPRLIPVRGANAAVARGPADRLGIVGAVNADMGLVQSHPQNADRVIRPRRQIVKDARFFAVLEHAFVVTEDR